MARVLGGVVSDLEHGTTETKTFDALKQNILVYLTVYNATESLRAHPDKPPAVYALFSNECINAIRTSTTKDELLAALENEWTKMWLSQSLLLQFSSYFHTPRNLQYFKQCIQKVRNTQVTEHPSSTIMVCG